MLRYQPGDVFGRLMIIELAPKEPRFHSCRGWRCRCSCGNEIVVPSSRLRLGQTQSCGCLHREMMVRRNTKHGLAPRGHVFREYRAWQDAKKRCHDPKARGYKRYGAKGIRMAQIWLNSFETFYAELGPCPKWWTLDRIDSTKGYQPGNCRWAPWLVQSNNRPTFNRPITWNGRTMNIEQWNRELGFTPGTIKGRLHRGWSIERAFTQAPRKK